MKLANPILKSIPARDLDLMRGEGPMMALPTHVEINGISYKLSVPKNLEGAIYLTDEVLLPARLVNYLDLKYDINVDNTEHAEIPPVFTETDLPTLDSFPGDEPEILNLNEAKSLINDFLHLYELVTGDTEWKTLTGKELLEYTKNILDKCLSEDIFGAKVPAISIFTDLLLSATSKDALSNMLPLIYKIRAAAFNSLATSDAEIFESTVLLVYLSILQKISGPAFVYDYIFGGIQPELKTLLSHSGIAELEVMSGGSTYTIKDKDDALGILELLKATINEDGTVSVETTGDIAFLSAKIHLDNNRVLFINEDVYLKRGQSFPYAARIVNGTEVAVVSTLPHSGVLTAFTESNVVFDDKQIGKLVEGNEETPIYTTIVKPADYRGFGKLKSIVPSIVTLGEFDLDLPEKRIITSTKESARETLLDLVKEKPKTLKTVQKILERTSLLTEKRILELVNLDSIFSPEHRGFVLEYASNNGFLLAPLGYNLSAQLLSVLKLNGFSARGRNVSYIPEYRQIFNTLWNSIHGITLNDEFSNELDDLKLAALATMSRKLVESLTKGSAIKLATTMDLKETHGDNLLQAAFIEQGITVTYHTKVADGTLVYSIPTESQFKYSRASLLVIDTEQGTKIVIPIILSLTETDVPQPNDGIQYLDNMVTILSGANTEEFVVYPTVFISGHVLNDNVVLKKLAPESQMVYLMRESLSRELVEVDPHVHQNSILLNIRGEWGQAIGNEIIKKCRCKL